MKKPAKKALGGPIGTPEFNPFTEGHTIPDPNNPNLTIPNPKYYAHNTKDPNVYSLTPEAQKVYKAHYINNTGAVTNPSAGSGTGQQYNNSQLAALGFNKSSNGVYTNIAGNAFKPYGEAVVPNNAQPKRTSNYSFNGKPIMIAEDDFRNIGKYTNPNTKHSWEDRETNLRNIFSNPDQNYGVAPNDIDKYINTLKSSGRYKSGGKIKGYANGGWVDLNGQPVNDNDVNFNSLSDAERIAKGYKQNSVVPSLNQSGQIDLKQSSLASNLMQNNQQGTLNKTPMQNDSALASKLGGVGEAPKTGGTASALGSSGLYGIAGNIAGGVAESSLNKDGETIGGDVAGGALRGAGTGATIGANPALMAATGGTSVLIGAGAGAIIGGVSGGVAGKKNRDARIKQGAYEQSQTALANQYNPYATNQSYKTTNTNKNDYKTTFGIQGLKMGGLVEKCANGGKVGKYEISDSGQIKRSAYNDAVYRELNKGNKDLSNHQIFRENQKINGSRYEMKAYRKAVDGEQSLSDGGKIVGKGTETSDSINASIVKDSFIVPTENSGLAKKIRENVLGQNPNKKASLKQVGGTKVKLSNGEQVFTPEEVEQLESEGIDISKLAPNAKEEYTSRFADGGPIKGDKIGDATYDGQKWVDSDGNTLSQNYITKIQESENAKQQGYNKQRVKTFQRQYDYIKNDPSRKKEASELKSTIDKLSGIKVNDQVSVKSGADLISVYGNTSSNLAKNIAKPIDVGNMSKASRISLYPENNNIISKDVNSVNPSALADISGIKELYKPTKEDQSGYLQNKYNIDKKVADDFVNGVKPKDQNKSDNFDLGSILGVGQSALGVGMLLNSSNKRPVYETTPEFKSQLSRTIGASQYGYSPEQRALLNNDIIENRNSALANVYNSAGGNGSVALGNARAVFNDTYNNRLKTASDDESLRISKLSAANNMANVNEQINRQKFGDNMQKFQQNQQAGSALLSSGLENILGASRYQNSKLTQRQLDYYNSL